MTLTWKDAVLIALVVAGVIMALRALKPGAKKPCCSGCAKKPAVNATTAAPAKGARGCSGGIALCR